MNSSLDDGFATAMRENFQQSLSSESHSSYHAFNTKNTNTTNTISSISHEDSFERPAKQTKTNSWNSASITEHASIPKPSSTTHFLSFGNSNSLPADSKQFFRTLDSSLKSKDEVVSHVNICVPLISTGSVENHMKTNSMTRTPSNAQDHKLAERKRREKLSQRFIALSAIVPGLKKVSYLVSDSNNCSL